MSSPEVFGWFDRWLRRTAEGPRPIPVDDSYNGLIYELPFPPGSSFRVSQGYGGAYSHTGESHFSIDFRMPEGTAVCASRGGFVYRVVNHFSEGGTHPSFKPKANAVYILHPDDSIAAYVHLMQQGNCVVPGVAVSTGQIIGYSGNTGWSGTPHLHFHVADAISHERLPTVFRTVESGIAQLVAGKSYTRPASHCQIPDTPVAPEGGRRDSGHERDAFAFSPDLLRLACEMTEVLAAAGYEKVADYSSIDVLHDVHGLEVCGIRGSDNTLEITRILLRHFVGWNAGWIHAAESSSPQGWVARIQRDRDAVMEYWDTD